MEQIQFIATSPDDLINKIDASFDKKLEQLTKNFQPKEPTKYITRQYVADEIIHCDISTVHNLTAKGILTKYQIGGRVLYIRQEVEDAIVKLKK